MVFLLRSLVTQALVRMSPSPVATEIQLQCSDGMVLAGQSWKASSLSSQHNNNNHKPNLDLDPSIEATAKTTTTTSPERILCLHGWMDNARSFHYLAPAIVQERPHVELIALDFIGHGLSSHKSMDGPPIVMAESVFYVAEALHQLGWIDNDHNDDNNKNNNKSKVTLIGHSMGAAISCLYAAAFPEHVQSLVFLDGAGPLDRNPRDIAKHVRQHVVRRRKALMQQPSKPTRVYPTLELAVETRCNTAKNFPGNQWLSTEAATQMVLRATEQVTTTTSTEQPENEPEEQPNSNNNNQQRHATTFENHYDKAATTTTTQVGYRFRHDPRLQWPSIQFLSWEQTEALYGEIQQHGIPRALFLGQDGWPFDPIKFQNVVQVFQPTVVETLSGSHHFHADPETAPEVAKKVLEFLQSTTRSRI